MTPTRQAFYYVINITDGRDDSFTVRPAKRHPNYNAAVIEAARLSTANPGKEFIIFAPLGGYVVFIPEPTPITYPVVY